ncbi:MAG: hypothetical protein ABI255_09020 [Microbacteriaceae bacterium]
MSDTIKTNGTGSPAAAGAIDRAPLAERAQAAEERARLQAAFPWLRHLPLAEREQFARELADHPSRSTDRDLDRLLTRWRARAEAYAKQRRVRRAA